MSGPAPVSLLFTPPAQKVPELQKSLDYRSRSRGRSPSVSPWGGRALSRDQTPPGRRSSLTPTQVRHGKDVPTPPPTDTLMESPGMDLMVTRASPLAGHGGSGEPGAGGYTAEPDTGAYGSEAAPNPFAAGSPPSRHAGASHAHSRARPPPPPPDSWITVFGFPSSAVPAVLRELSLCGELERYGAFGAPRDANWMHARFATREAADRALLLDGRQVARGIMVGVRAANAQLAERLELESAGSEGAGAGRPAGVAFAPSSPATFARVPGSLRGRDASSDAPAIIPLARRSTWSKLGEFVLGW